MSYPGASHRFGTTVSWRSYPRLRMTGSIPEEMTLRSAVRRSGSWSQRSQYSGIRLSKLTHALQPHSVARRGLGASAWSPSTGREPRGHDGPRTDHIPGRTLVVGDRANRVHLVLRQGVHVADVGGCQKRSCRSDGEPRHAAARDDL